MMEKNFDLPSKHEISQIITCNDIKPEKADYIEYSIGF